MQTHRSDISDVPVYLHYTALSLIELAYFENLQDSTLKPSSTRISTSVFHSLKSSYLEGKLLLTLFYYIIFLYHFEHRINLYSASTFRFPYFLPSFTISMLLAVSCIACIWLPVNYTISLMISSPENPTCLQTKILRF